MASKPSECFDLDQVIQEIAASLQVALGQVRATVELLDAGNTIPFIARYRKEATDGLDEISLREIEDSFGKARIELVRPLLVLAKGVGRLTPRVQQASSHLR